MKTKTHNLIGDALDWAVGIADDSIEMQSLKFYKGTLKHDTGGTMWESWSPSTDWSQGGPIIEQEGISTVLCSGDLGEPRSYWVAVIENQAWSFGYGPYHEQDDEKSIQIFKRDIYIGPTLLIAAMRCYVASKLGNEVDIPEGLQ